MQYQELALEFGLDSPISILEIGRRFAKHSASRQLHAASPLNFPMECLLVAKLSGPGDRQASSIVVILILIPSLVVRFQVGAGTPFGEGVMRTMLLRSPPSQ